MKKAEMEWAEAKKRCHLDEDDIQMARELGMTPKSLLKNIPSRSKQWKQPVREWVRELYEDSFDCIIKNGRKVQNEEMPL